MKLTVHVHKDEESGFWAEVPELPGTVTQGDTLEELAQNVQDAIAVQLEGIVEDYAEGRVLQPAEPIAERWEVSVSISKPRLPVN